MTGVPSPRGSEAGTGSDSYLVRGFEQLRVELQTGFRELREQLAGFVTQREFERLREGTTLELADLRRLREQDQRDREAAERTRELTEQQRATERRNDRWQRIALAIGTATAVATTIVGLVIQSH